jgi:hypothetical protein
MDITNQERLNLKKLISETECDDNTEYIRKIKHSDKIRADMRVLEQLKLEKDELRKSDPAEFVDLARNTCSFLFTNYTDIFNKAIKDEINIEIMERLLLILKMIEENKVDQHEGSVYVGRILKELYLDSAVKHADALDKRGEEEKAEPIQGRDISWSDYKTKNKIK